MEQPPEYIIHILHLYPSQKLTLTLELFTLISSIFVQNEEAINILPQNHQNLLVIFSRPREVSEGNQTEKQYDIFIVSQAINKYHKLHQNVTSSQSNLHIYELRRRIDEQPLKIFAIIHSGLIVIESRLDVNDIDNLACVSHLYGVNL